MLDNLPAVFGIINVTPDSFSDGGTTIKADSVLLRAQELINAGADYLDIGGESTRPGARTISVQEELDRVMPALEAILSNFDVALSIDTSKPQVMVEALKLGVNIVNDVNALQAEGAIEVVKHYDAKACLMHMQGSPSTMQKKPHYHDVVEEVKSFLHARIRTCIDAGIAFENLIVDPGFGFGKCDEHNLRLIKHLKSFTELGCPVLVGFSRKSLIGNILNAPIDQRMIGGIVLAILALFEGVNMIRTHDVHETKQALNILKAVQLGKIC